MESKINRSLGKALSIIEYMVDSSGPKRLQDIAADLKLPASTAHRFLNTLVLAGYVEQNEETLKYKVTYKLCVLGQKAQEQNNILTIVHPYLKKLSSLCGESTCLAIEEERSVIYIDSVDGVSNTLKTTQRIGKKAPLHCTGVGKLILLNYSDSDINKYIEEKGLTYLTEHTLVTKDDLVEDLSSIRNEGYALDNEECEIGIKCIAAPLYNYKKEVVAAISVSAPSSRFTKEKTEMIKKYIINIAKQINDILNIN